MRKILLAVCVMAFSIGAFACDGDHGSDGEKDERSVNISKQF